MSKDLTFTVRVNFQLYLYAAYFSPEAVRKTLNKYWDFRSYIESSLPQHDSREFGNDRRRGPLRVVNRGVNTGGQFCISIDRAKKDLHLLKR